MMDDLISREAALDCFHDWIDQRGDVHTADEMVEYQRIEALPAVQRVESVGMRWIPCAERFPEEDLLTGMGVQYSESVLVTVLNHANDDELVVDSAYTRDGEWKMQYPIDGDPDFPEWCEVIAWRELPEPYKEEE